MSKNKDSKPMEKIAPRYEQRKGANSDHVHNQRAALSVKSTSTPTARQELGKCRVGKR